jgi:Predicted integral membrane protein (DUF2269)
MEAHRCGRSRFPSTVSMTNAYLLIKTVHIISATILFGTGLGIAFFMFRSRFTDRLQEKFYAVRTASSSPRPRSFSRPPARG